MVSVVVTEIVTVVADFREGRFSEAYRYGRNGSAMELKLLGLVRMLDIVTGKQIGRAHV